jgi:Uma2 family endonuclease
MSTLPKTYLTPEQYREIERKAEFKSEYWKGEMFSMPGASRWHDWINTQLLLPVASLLRGKGRAAFSANVRVLAEPGGLYTYRDLSVVCGAPKFVDCEFDTLKNPTLLVEILSPGTEAYDRAGRPPCIGPFRHFKNCS